MINSRLERFGLQKTVYNECKILKEMESTQLSHRLEIDPDSDIADEKLSH